MNEAANVLNNFQPYIVIGLAFITLILIITNIVTLNSISKLEKRYKRMMRGVNNKNLEELVLDYLEKVDKAKSDTEYMKELYKLMDSRLKGCIQKVAVVRYRAFEDVGSDLSFSIAMLNDDNNGVVLTGIYGRNESTTYAKPIDSGISRYELSDEEKTALNNAINKSIK